MTRLSFDLVVWDFDGVLNRNICDGRFVWSGALQADLGLERDDFDEFVFRSGRVRDVVRGQRDILEVVAEWLSEQDAGIGAETLLDYWFEKDALPDPETGELLTLHAGRRVIGTNNEARRADYIEGPMGFGARVERVFASGRMGVAKPDDGFFAAIENWAGLAPGRILLIDDAAGNVAAAHRRRWNAFHFTDETRHRLAGVLGVG